LPARRQQNEKGTLGNNAVGIGNDRSYSNYGTGWYKH